MQELIEKLVSAYGPSGFEDKVRDIIRPEVEGHADEIRVDALGNLIVRKKGDGSGRRVMVAAHMDEIGVMVTHVTKEGFLRFTNIGGVYPHTLMGSRVQFADGTTGVIYSEKLEDRGKVHPLDKHYIDIGASSREEAPIAVGSAGAFVGPFQQRGDHFIAKSMDDRIGCAIAIAALQRLESTPHDLYVVFSVQEEVGTRGAQAAANMIAPEIGLAIDVTGTGDTPGAANMAVELGKGAAIKVKDRDMIAHGGLVQLMRQRASEAGITCQMEVLEAGSTDARSIQIAGAGSAAGAISVPCRYVHSQSELVHGGDVENSVRLLVELLAKPMEL